MEANYQLQRFLEETMPLDKLIECHAELGQGVGTVDGGLFSHLSTKINEGKIIREDAKRFLKVGMEYNPKPLCIMARLVIRAQENKVQIPELDEIKAIVESFILLSNVYAILYGIQPLKMDHLESDDLGHFKDKALVELIVGCQGKFHTISSLSDAKITKLRMIHGKFEEISKSCDGQFFQETVFPCFFKNLSQALEKIPANRPSSIAIEDDIEECVIPSSQAYNMEEEVSYSPVKVPNNSQQVVSVSKSLVQGWKDEVDGFLHRGPEERLLEILEGAGEEDMDYGQIFESLEELKESSQKLINAFINNLKRTPQVEQENKAVERIFNWADWTIQAIKARRQIHEDKLAVEPEIIFTLKKKMDEYKLPRNALMCKTIAEWYKVLDNGMKEYEKMYPESARGFGMKRDMKATFGNYTHEDIEKMRVKEIMEKVKQYGGKRDVKQMRNAEVLLANISKLFNVTKEVGQIKEDLAQHNSWSDDVVDIGIKYMSYKEEDLANREKINIMKNDLEIIKRKLLELRIWEDADETTLRLLDLMLQSGDIVKFHDKKISLDEARQILEEAVCFGEVDGDGGRLVNLTEGVRNEVDKAETVKIIIKSLKEGQKLNFKDTHRWLECIKNCKIKLDEEQKILEKAQKDCLEVKDKVERFLNSCSAGRKSHSSEFKEILDKISGLSIKLPDEEEKVKRAIKVGELIKADCLRYEREAKEGLASVQTMINLVERYRTSTVYVEEAENIKKALKKIHDTNDFLISKQKELTSSFCSLSFQDVLALEKEVNEIDVKGKGETGYEREARILRKDILVKKCELIANKHDVQITPSTLQELIREADKVARDYRSDERLFRGVHGLRDLDSKYKTVIEKLNKTKSLEELERIPRYVENVLDISSELTKKREEINKSNALILEAAARKKETSNQMTSFLKKERADLLDYRREKDEEREAEKYRDGFDRIFSKETAKETSRQSSQGGGGLRDLLLGKATSFSKRQPDYTNNSSSRLFREERRSPERVKTIIKEVPKDRHSALGEIKELLESSEHFEMTMTECFESSKAILKGFPEMLKSAETFTKIMNKLSGLIRSRYVAESLLKQQFEKTYLKGLLDLDEDGVASLEVKLKDQLQGKEDKEKEMIAMREQEERERERERQAREQEEKERLLRVRQQEEEERERQRRRQLEIEQEEQRLKEIQHRKEKEELERTQRELMKRLEEEERERKLEEERLREQQRQRKLEEERRREEERLAQERERKLQEELERDLELKRYREKIEELQRQLKEKEQENLELKQRKAREEEAAAAAAAAKKEQEKRNSFESHNVKTPNRNSKDLLTATSLPYADKISTASTLSKIEIGTTAKKLALDKEVKTLKANEETVNMTSPTEDHLVSKRLAFDTSSSKTETTVVTEKESKDPRVYKGVSPKRDVSPKRIDSKSRSDDVIVAQNSGALKVIFSFS